jgi:hypothetical protein
MVLCYYGVVLLWCCAAMMFCDCTVYDVSLRKLTVMFSRMSLHLFRGLNLFAEFVSATVNMGIKRLYRCLLVFPTISLFRSTKYS